MTIEDREVVKAVGLEVARGESEEAIGSTTDVIVGDEGRVMAFQVKRGWPSQEYMLTAANAVLAAGKLVSSEQQAPEEIPHPTSGLMNLPVHTRGGQSLGKVTNVLVEAPAFHVIGLELSSGVIRDWIKGRSVVVFGRSDQVPVTGEAVIILPDEIEITDERIMENWNAEDSGSAEVIAAPLTAEQPIDWRRVRDTPEETVQRVMAEVVWERHGSPRTAEGETTWLDLVRPWATALKRAAGDGGSNAYDDVALLTDDEVEAIRPFREGQEIGASPQTESSVTDTSVETL